MSRQRVTLGLALAVTSLAACSGEDSLPHKTASSSAGSTGTAHGGGGIGGGGGAGLTQSGAGAGEVGGDGGAGPVALGAIDVVDEPDTPCAATRADPSEIYAAADNALPLDRLSRVGARWMATAIGVPGGFVTFGDDGSAASPAPVREPGEDYDIAAAEGAAIGRVGAIGSEIVYTRFDAQDTTIAGPITVAPDLPANVAIGGDDAGNALVLWGTTGAMHARALADGAFAGEAFDFGTGTIGAFFVGSVAAAGQASFAAAWTATLSEDHVTSFTRLDAGGVVGSIVTVAKSPVAHRVVKIVGTPLGYALLVDATFPPATTLVLLLDHEGVALGPAHRFLGVASGFDLAATEAGDGYAVVARRVTGEVELRMLDVNGTPFGPWICLAASSKDLYASGAAAHDVATGGYAVIYRDASGTEQLIGVDKFGSL